MLRTSLRKGVIAVRRADVGLFLSSNAQDFIEDATNVFSGPGILRFLSSNAQDFIEESRPYAHYAAFHIPEQ